MRIIWSCPVCGADLDDELWCGTCATRWTPAQLSPDDPPDYHHLEN
jgi:hypothetical protein